MTLLFANLLADDVHWEKLAPIAIVFGIWALGAISSALKKSGPATQRRNPAPPMKSTAVPPPIQRLTLAQQMGVRTQGRPTGPGGIMNLLREAQARAQAMAQAQAEARKRAEAFNEPGAGAPARRKTQSKPAKSAPPRIVSPPPLRPPSSMNAPSPSEAELVKSQAQPRQVTVGSTKFGLRPETLRQQYIVMEILLPPVALREPRD